MNPIDRIVGEIRDAFKYFKARSKNKYYGDRFEEWVVKNSNISRDGSPVSNSGKPFWRLLDWRGDKYIEGYRPLSSSSPDLLLECLSISTTSYKSGDIIAVECKWKSKKGFYIDKESVRKYEEYIIANEHRFPIKSLFYVFGFGWSGNKPEEVFVVPAKALYDYDKENHVVKYPVNENSEDKIKRIQENYKVLSKYLMYFNN